MVESHSQTKRKPKALLIDLVLFSLGGGLAGIPACWVWLLTEEFFHYYVLGYSHFVYLDGNPSAVGCATYGFCAGLLPGAFHGVICGKYRSLRKRVVNSTLFWTVLGTVAFFSGVAFNLWEGNANFWNINTLNIFVGYTLASAAFGAVLAVWGKLVTKLLRACLSDKAFWWKD